MIRTWIARLVATSAALALHCAVAQAMAGPGAASNATPLLDHILVIVEENHSYDEVRTLPYTASLIAAGSSLGNSHGVTHPSQPNYLALWSGSTQGVTSNVCPPPGSPFLTENLGHACEAAGITWRAYCERLPFAGSDTCDVDGQLYARKHAPWTHFGNLTHLNERPYADLDADIAAGTLPRLAFVIPDQCNDSHNGGACSIELADAWLAARVPQYLNAVGPNGIVVLTWDEDDNQADNHILTVFSGPLVRSGYVSSRYATHYTVLRTLTEALGLAPFGAAVQETPLDDIWAPTSPTGIEAPPARIALSAPAPNPSARGAVRWSLDAPAGRRVEAAIVDAAGRTVRAWTATTGSRTTLEWDGHDETGREVAAGVYRLQLRIDGATWERRLMRLR